MIFHNSFCVQIFLGLFKECLVCLPARTHAHTHTHTHTHAHTLMHTNTRICAHTHECMHTQTHIQTHRHTHKHTHRHRHRHTHAHTHTQVNMLVNIHIPWQKEEQPYLCYQDIPQLQQSFLPKGMKVKNDCVNFCWGGGGEGAQGHRGHTV